MKKLVTTFLSLTLLTSIDLCAMVKRRTGVSRHVSMAKQSQGKRVAQMAAYQRLMRQFVTEKDGTEGQAKVSGTKPFDRIQEQISPFSDQPNRWKDDRWDKACFSGRVLLRNIAGPVSIIAAHNADFFPRTNLGLLSGVLAYLAARSTEQDRLELNNRMVQEGKEGPSFGWYLGYGLLQGMYQFGFLTQIGLGAVLIDAHAFYETTYFPLCNGYPAGPPPLWVVAADLACLGFQCAMMYRGIKSMSGIFEDEKKRKHLGGLLDQFDPEVQEGGCRAEIDSLLQEGVKLGSVRAREIIEKAIEFSQFKKASLLLDALDAMLDAHEKEGLIRLCVEKGNGKELHEILQNRWNSK